MTTTWHCPSLSRHLLAACLALPLACATTAQAQAPQIADFVAPVVRVKTFINPDGRTLSNLGREREGSGIVIDDSGLILTIGYLIVEAYATEVTNNDGHAVPANVVAYDHETGFGLLRATAPLNVRPMALGKSGGLKAGDPVIVASFGGPERATPALVADRREFAGSWEYLLEDAIFTSPPHPLWGGAALIDSEGKLVGVGSLLVADAGGKAEGAPGNMFVPIDTLTPVFADLMASGRPQGRAHPWLGLNTEETGGKLVVNRVTPNGPADKAGLKHGDIIVGVKGNAAKTLADFYRKVWALGGVGTIVPLDVSRSGETWQAEVKSANRRDHLRLKSTF